MDTRQETVMVELKQVDGEIDVAFTAEQVVEKSSMAIENALKTIQTMAQKVVNTISAIPLSERPTEIEVSFGIKLTSDATAFVVNAGVEAQINVKLGWTQKVKDEQTN